MYSFCREFGYIFVFLQLNCKQMEIIVQQLQELREVAQQLLTFAAERRKFAFYGEIGAGKTTFIQAICQQLGVREAVVSPTFALVNEYSYADAAGNERIAYHLDLYRLKNMQEALDIGIEDLLYDEHYCFIEWPELVEALLPEDVVRVRIETLKDAQRKMVFS